MLVGPMRLVRAIPALLGALLGLLVLVPRLQADPQISGLQVTLDGQRALVSLHLRDAFDRRLSDRLESGLPTTILYRFELSRDRKRWYDSRMDTATLEATAVHDAVARAYTVHFKLDGELIDSRTVRERKELEEAMTRIERLPVFNLEGVKTTRRILVRARAELGSRTILSFIPVALNTDWEESNKFRRPRP